MTGSVKLVAAALVGLSMTGCVAQEKYNALSLEADALREQLAIAGKDAAAARERADAYQKQLEALGGLNGSSKDVMEKLIAANGDLNRQLADLNQKYMELAGRAGQTTVLPTQLSNALEELAKAHPDLMEFDAARGVIRFKADVTFASGDATLTPAARRAVQEFAGILNSQASGYEFLVVGHTDNVTHFTAATIARGHKDNWYLSAHRAISVAELLISSSVSPDRLGVTGYADEHPIASNASEAGKAKNRRVEVVILPTTFGKPSAGGGTKTAPAEMGNKS